MKNGKRITYLLASVMILICLLSGCGDTEKVIDETMDKLNEVVDKYGEEIKDGIKDYIKDDIQGAIDGLQGNANVKQEIEEYSPLDDTKAGTYVIMLDDLPVYSAPDYNAKVVDTYPEGQVVTVSGVWKEAGFYEVVDNSGNIIGYVDTLYCSEQ